MILFAAVFAVLSAAFAAKAAQLTNELRAARLTLIALQRRAALPPAPATPAPVRQFECRSETHGLLWFPVLTARDGEKLVVGVSSGLPHCARCVKALKLAPGRPESWNCGGCGASHSGAAADLAATDRVLTGCLREFFARHPDYAPAPGLSAPKCESAEAA